MTESYTPPTDSFDPTEDRLVVQPDEAPTMYSEQAKIEIPESHRARPCIGTVVCVGPGMSNKPMNYSPGDRIMYGRVAGVEIEDPYEKGKIYLIMRAGDVFCRIKKTNLL